MLADQTQYAIRINGQIVGVYATRTMAEAAIIMIPSATRPLAEVVAIQAGTNKEILLG